MGEHEGIDRAKLAVVELGGVQFGDRRLEKRSERIVEALARSPWESLPKAVGGSSELEATYRFLGNERVTPEAIISPHQAKTLERCQAQGQVLAVFDTTEVRFGGQRDELGYLDRTAQRGLLAHVGLTVTADGRREPLGVVHHETVVRRGSPKRRRGGIKAPDRESLRWNRGVDGVHEKLPSAICVMDREADIFELLQTMALRGQDFIVRAAQNRNTSEGRLWERLDDAELRTTREIELESRKLRRGSTARKRFPPRSKHQTMLEIRACPVALKAPGSTKNSTMAAKSAELTVHVVHVVEPNPPEGDPPVEWVLLTSLPIECPQDVDFIVDCYQARWVIEEFFKALKSGCRIEARQLEGRRSILNMLAISLPIAWLLLRLRNLGRDEPGRPGAPLLSPLMLECLRILYTRRTRKALPEDPTAHDVLWAIAALGGHIKNNGQPGFIVLGRGLDSLLEATSVVEAMRGAATM